MKPEDSEGSNTTGDGIATVELRYDSMRQFQAELAPNLSREGIFIPHPSASPPSTVVRFTVRLPDDFVLLEGVGVVLWSRGEDLGAGQPAGMALRFASLGPRSQELIDSVVDAFVDDGGSPFELESVGEGDEFIPTDALVGRGALPEHRPLPSLRDRRVDDETPRLRVRGEDDDIPRPRTSRSGLEEGVTAVTGAREAVPPIAATARGSGIGRPPSISEAATEELWRDGLRVLEASHETGAEPGMGEPGGPTGAAAELEPPGVPPFSSDLEPEEPEEVDIPREPERAPPPMRPATRPSVGVDTVIGGPGQRDRSRDEVTAAQLVAEVIADEESRARGAEGREGGAVAGESDDAVDTFADSLRSLDLSRTEPGAGTAPEVTIVSRDEDEAEQPPRGVPWAALAAVAAVLAVAVAGYLAREPIARLLVPEVPEEGSSVDGGEAAGHRSVPPAATPTAVAVVSVATPTAPPPEPSPQVEPSPTPAAEPTPVEPAAAPRQPTAAPTSARPPSGPAGRVEDIRWTTAGGRTVVTIVADGALTEERVRVGTMSDPPRVLVKLLRVDRYRRFELPVGTGELERIRIGHHPEQSPPSLHVVLDLSGPGVSLESFDVVGSEVRLTLGR